MRISRAIRDRFTAPCDIGGEESAVEMGHQHRESSAPRGSTSLTASGAQGKAGRRKWDIETLAHVFSQDLILSGRRELKTALRRIPYHGLWAGARDFKPQQTLVYAQLGQDIVRSCNVALGQYSTAENLGKFLTHAYQKSCRQCRRIGIPIEILGQEYNMVFLRTFRPIDPSEARRVQDIFNAEVWKKIDIFLLWAAKDSEGSKDEIEAVSVGLSRQKPIINLGLAVGLTKGKGPAVDQMARTAIAASAAAKLARLKDEGIAFANATDILSALKSYKTILEQHRSTIYDGMALVLLAPDGHLLLNPSILSLFRAKKLEMPCAGIVARAVGLLNCLDWVQQSRFTDLEKLTKQAQLGRKMIRALDSWTTKDQLADLKAFALKHVPYLAIAEALTRSEGTLFWVDMKKLAVRCHIIREAEAMNLLRRQDAGENLQIDHIVDAMIKIDLRVQDARDVLQHAQQAIESYLKDINLKCEVTFHVGGDDAAFFVSNEGLALDKNQAKDLGNYLSVNTDKLRIAHCTLPKGSDVAEELCRIDRILTATKLD